MTDAVLIVPPGFRLLDASGNPVSGGKFKFFAAGTTTPLTVYSDDTLSTSLGTVVTCDSGGYPANGSGTKTLVYTGSADYKVLITDANDNTLATHDNVKGAVTGGSGSGTYAKPATPVDTGAATVTLTTSDLGKVKNLNPTSAAITVVLPSAVDVGNASSKSNWITIRNIGTTNAVTVVPVSSQTIDGAGSKTVSSQYDSIVLCSDGANWHQLAFSRSSLSSGAITSDLLDTRIVGGLAVVGDIKLIASETVPAGWLECNGAAVSRTTYSALFAKIGVTHGQGDGATTFNIPDYRGRFFRAWDHGAGRDPDAASRTAMATGGQTGDHVGSVQTDGFKAHTHSLSLGATAVQSGGGINVRAAGSGDVTGSTGGNETRPTNANVMAIIMADPAAAAGAANALNTIYNGSGVPSSGTGVNGDFYIDTANNKIFGPKAAGAWPSGVSLVGPTGATGATGSAGADAGWSYTWSTDTTATDPTSGKIKVNNATLASATALYISETNGDSASIASEIATWDDGTSTVKGTLKISKSGSSANFVIFQITGTMTDNGTWDTFTVAFVASAGTISNSDAVKVNFIRAGDLGNTGSAGPTGATGASGPVPIDYTWDTGTSAADPGSGKLRANNATLSSATAIYINETDRLGNALATFIQQWDDSTNTTKGQLIVIDTTNPANRVYFNVTGTITDNGSYDTITVNYASGATSLTAVNVALMFVRSGDKGADGSGSFTSLTPGNGVTSDVTANAPGSAITTSGTISAAEPVNAQVGTSYTVVDGDRAKLVTFSNAASIAVTLPQAGQTTTFKTGWFCDVINLGAGAVTITPTTSTINGASTLVLNTGQGCRVISDGTNYQINRKPPLGSLTGIIKAASGIASAATAGTDYMKPDTTSVISKGFTLTPNLIGTVSSGTTTLDPTLGNYQMLINGGAFTLAPPATGTYDAIDLLIIAGPSAGSITLSSTKWRVGSNTGDALATAVRATATVTMTIASPCVVSWTGHGCADGDPVWFTTSGALPTGLTASTVYYVKYIDANSFNLATTPGGSSINTSGSQSGTQTCNAASQFVFTARQIYGSSTYLIKALQ